MIRFALLVLALALSLAARATPPQDPPPGLQRALEVQQLHEAGLFSRRGVVGVGVGFNAAGRETLKVLTDGPGVRGLPASLEDVPVEVLVTGPIRPLQTTNLPTSARWPRPVPIGISTGHTNVTAGTIGCQVWRGDGCHTQLFMLSNNHIIANSNNATIGERILQPGPADGGVFPNDTIALLADFEPIVFSQTASNTMDAAIAEVDDLWLRADTPPDGYGQPRSTIVSPQLNLNVQKFGRTTRMTYGKVSILNLTALIQYSQGTARFVSQFAVAGNGGTAFSQPGDSGSLVVGSGGQHDRKPVGLLFASGTLGDGSPISIGSPIGPILSRFGVVVSGN